MLNVYCVDIKVNYIELHQAISLLLIFIFQPPQHETAIILTDEQKAGNTYTAFLLSLLSTEIRWLFVYSILLSVLSLICLFICLLLFFVGFFWGVGVLLPSYILFVFVFVISSYSCLFVVVYHSVLFLFVLFLLNSSVSFSFIRLAFMEVSWLFLYHFICVFVCLLVATLSSCLLFCPFCKPFGFLVSV